MARLMTILCVLCLAGAIALSLRPDPWAKANQKSALDAELFAGLVAQPDRIGWRITEDVAVLRVMLWDQDGARRYPSPEGLTPLPYEFSRDLTRQLTQKQSTIASFEWEPFDMSGNELLNCRASPAICIVYDRARLEETLALRPDALSSGKNVRNWSIVLALLAAAFGGVGIWVARRSRPVAPTLIINPERHSAMRGTLEVALSPRDLKLLRLLDQRDGAVVTKDELYDAGWGREFMPNSRALDQHIANLRRKLDPDKSRPVLIETVHGVGYRLVR